MHSMKSLSNAKPFIYLIYNVNRTIMLLNNNQVKLSSCTQKGMDGMSAYSASAWQEGFHLPTMHLMNWTYQLQPSQGKCHSFNFANSEVLAWISIKGKNLCSCLEGRHSKTLPRRALVPISELGKAHKSMTIL